METSILPGIELTLVINWVTQMFFLSLRFGAFLLAGPGFGGRFVPLPVRIVATISIAMFLMGRVPVPDVEEMAKIAFLPVVFTELLIGLTAGLVLTILFGAAAVAGDRIANTAGLGFAAQFDPASGSTTPVISQIFGLFVLMIFIGTDGHLVAFRILLESYIVMPPGTIPDFDLFINTGLEAGGHMFLLGMKIMLPIVATLLLLNIMVGVFTRSAPQLNVFSFGFPITITATIVLLYLTVPGIADAFDMLVRDGLSLVNILFGGR